MFTFIVTETKVQLNIIQKENELPLSTITYTYTHIQTNKTQLNKTHYPYGLMGEPFRRKTVKNTQDV